MRFRGKWLGIAVGVFSVLIVSIVLIASSLKRLKTSEVGVEYDTQEKELGASKDGGLHAGPPFFEFLRYSAVYITRKIETTCISKDGLKLPVTCSFQYLPDRSKLKEITQRYRDAGEYDDIIMAAAKSAINHGCGDFGIEEFQSRRLEVQERQKQYLTEIFEGRKGQQALLATVIDLQLENISPPSRWEEAVEDKQSASEDIRLARNERLQKMTAANTRLRVAEEQARIVENNATTSASVILNRAERQAEALLDLFKKLADQTKVAMDTLDLDVESTARYLLNRQVETKKRIFMSLKQPVVTPNDEL